MISLHRIRPLRPGTQRFSISGIDGVDDDDRAICSVWPQGPGEDLRLMVIVDGSIGGIGYTVVPANISRDAMATEVAELVAALTDGGAE